MIVGWVFVFFIEGVSGFGMLVVIVVLVLCGLGFVFLWVVMFCLVFNIVLVMFGVMGMLVWFGFLLLLLL